MSAAYGAVVDCVLYIGPATWRTLSYSRSLTQSLIDRLNSTGFKVLSLDDSNLALLSGGTMKVRVQIVSDGYANASDAASVVQGAAAALGFNVQSFTGALVQSGRGGSQVTYNDNALNRDNTTGLPSLKDLLPSDFTNMALFIGGVFVLVWLIRD